MSYHTYDLEQNTITDMDIYAYESLRLEHCGIAATELHLHFLKELPVLARQQKNSKQEKGRTGQIGAVHVKEMGRVVINESR